MMKVYQKTSTKLEWENAKYVNSSKINYRNILLLSSEMKEANK